LFKNWRQIFRGKWKELLKKCKKKTTKKPDKSSADEMLSDILEGNELGK